MQTITVGSKQLDIYDFTGVVAETGKNLETKVSGGGGGGATFRGYGGTAPVTITSRTVVHDQIFLIDKEGNEKSFQLQGFNVACRAENKLSVLWAVAKGKSSGPYIIVHNHTTKETFYNDQSIGKLFRTGQLLIILAAIVAAIIISSFSGWLAFFVFVGGVIYSVVNFNSKVKALKSSVNYSGL